MLLKIEVSRNASNGDSSYVYTVWKERIDNIVKNKMEETGLNIAMDCLMIRCKSFA